jgi:hypothetical protein
MARIRTIKPEFYKHEALYLAEKEENLPLRIAFSGLWTVCDREGRFKWRPNTIKLDVLPFDDVDFSRVLDALATRGFIVQYASQDGELYGFVPTFLEHQVINNRESKSLILSPFDACATRDPRGLCMHMGKGKEGKGKEGKGKEGKGKEGTLPASQPDLRGAFRMFPEWKPSAHFQDLAKQSMLTVTDAKIAEFIAYWLTQEITKRTQAEWDKSLLQSAQHDKLRAASKPIGSPKPDNFAGKDYGQDITPL